MRTSRWDTGIAPALAAPSAQSNTIGQTDIAGRCNFTAPPPRMMNAAPIIAHPQLALRLEERYVTPGGDRSAAPAAMRVQIERGRWEWRPRRRGTGRG